MTRTLTALAVLGLALPAVAEEISPADVVWIDDVAIETPLTAEAGDAENGKALMNKGAGNCIACHAVTALEDVYAFHGEIGPVLDGVADRYTEAELRGIVANAKNMFPDSMMPSFYKTEGFIRPGDGFTAKAAPEPIQPLLTAKQIEDVVAYLKTLTESS